MTICNKKIWFVSYMKLNKNKRRNLILHQNTAQQSAHNFLLSSWFLNVYLIQDYKLVVISPAAEIVI